MTAPLSPAEAAVAGILRRGWANGRGLQVPIEDRAREITAAVEPHLTIAALERTAAALDELAADNARVGRGTAEGPWIAAGVQGAALNVRRQIRDLRQSLSLPASKETQQ
jgi:hypothetical protein